MSEPSKSPEQTALPAETLGDGAVPPGVLCEWCTRRAKHSFEFTRKIKGGKKGAVVRTGMFVYTCDHCKDIGELNTRDPKPALRKG